MYKIKKKSAKALIYCEQSVLENMHSSKLFNLIKESEVDIFASVKEPVNYFKFHIKLKLLNLGEKNSAEKIDSHFYFIH